MTKREAMSQIPAEDLKLVAAAAALYVGKNKGSENARIRKAAKVLAQVQAGRQKEE